MIRSRANSVLVRFNLSNGKNYMHWKVEYPDGKSEYLNPEEVTIDMHNAFLHSSTATAQHIKNGYRVKKDGTKVKMDRAVCGYVLCESITISKGSRNDLNKYLQYNPKKSVNWELNSQSVTGNTYTKLSTQLNGIFINKK